MLAKHATRCPSAEASGRSRNASSAARASSFSAAARVQLDDGCVVRVEQQKPGGSVDRQRAGGRRALDEPGDADHGGDPQSASQDRRVRGPGAALERDPGEERAVEFHGHRWREVAGHHDRTLLEGRSRRADHVTRDPRGDVAHVRGARGEQLVVEPLEDRGGGLAGGTHRVRRVLPRGLALPRDADQLLVDGHEGLGVEDRGLLVALVKQLSGELLELRCGGPGGFGDGDARAARRVRRLEDPWRGGDDAGSGAIPRRRVLIRPRPPRRARWR